MGWTGAADGIATCQAGGVAAPALGLDLPRVAEATPDRIGVAPQCP